MPKIDWAHMDWKAVSPGRDWQPERWADKSPEQQAGEIAWAWGQWIIASCAEAGGGHAWWLDWDEEDGLWLHCRHCPAGVDELYPDGQDLIFAELPLPGGRKLAIDCGSVALAAPVREWHGPVRVWVEETYHPGGPWGGPEWDAWVNVEAA